MGSRVQLLLKGCRYAYQLHGKTAVRLFACGVLAATAFAIGRELLFFRIREGVLRDVAGKVSYGEAVEAAWGEESRSEHLRRYIRPCLSKQDSRPVHSMVLRPTKHLLPLSLFPEILSLSIHNSSATDLNPLSTCRNLRTLNCTGSAIASLSPIRSLQRLETLGCYRTDIHDLGPLSEVYRLRVLDAEDTQVTDISPLVGLRNLRELYLRRTLVRDFSPLQQMPQLEQLAISISRVTEIEPLAHLKNLNWLTIEVDHGTSPDVYGAIRSRVNNLFGQSDAKTRVYCQTEVSQYVGSTSTLEELRIFESENVRQLPRHVDSSD